MTTEPVSAPQRAYSLDPVTFEVLKNAFITIVDEMAEQILRTCHSFVIWARDFSSALCDANGDTIMQGTGTSPCTSARCATCKSIIEAFAGGRARGRRVRDERSSPAARTSTTCASCGRSSTTVR